MGNKVKVVVDTNSIFNSGIGNKFFGFRKDIEDIIERIDLYVPDIVMKEMLAHKRKSFHNAKTALLHNDLFRIVDGDANKYKVLDSKTIIDSDMKSENIPYHLLPPVDMREFFSKFEDMLIRNKPPFETDSDKGIKDALIAYSTDLLLDEFPDEQIILVCNDARLKEYFINNDKVHVVNKMADVASLLEHSDGLVVKKKHKIKIEFAGVREKTAQRKRIEKLLTDFRNSINFSKTHEFVKILKKNLNFLTLDDKVDIIKSALNNNQIRWIVGDQDIYDFLCMVYADCASELQKDLDEEIKILLGLNL